MARAGWPAAKNVATMASTIAIDDHRPWQGEHRDEVVRALLVVRAVGQPGRQAQSEAHQSPYHPDDRRHSPGARVGRCGRSLPSTRASRGRSQSALRQHGEASDRHQRDQQHADGRQCQHDGVGIDRVGGAILRRRRRRWHRYCPGSRPVRRRGRRPRSGWPPAPGEPARTRRAGSGGSARCRRLSFLPGTRCHPPRRSSSDASPGVMAIWSGPVG